MGNSSHPRTDGMLGHLPRGASADRCSSPLSAQMTSNKPYAQQCAGTREVLIADANVPGIEALLQDLDPTVEVWMCDGAEGDDALDILAEGLRLPNISRVHLVALGQPGLFVMGGKPINSEHLNARFRVRPRSGSQMTEIVLWSSNVAANAIGRDFVSLLAELTGCRVRAASRPLGNIDGDSCWTLDVVVRPHVPFKPSQMNAFTESLNLGHYAANCPELGAHAWPTADDPQSD